MKLSTLAAGSSNVVVVALCGLWGTVLLLPLPAHAQVNLTELDQDINKNNKFVLRRPLHNSRSDDSNPILSAKLAGHSNRSSWQMVGIGSVLLLTGIGISFWEYKRRQALAAAEENEYASPPTPTETQRKAAVAKAARISGRLQDPLRSREYLKRLQELPVTVTDYHSAMTALKAIYMLCRDTERPEPVLCRLLTEGWRTLDAYREDISEKEWLKLHTDEFRNHLMCIGLETDALIQKSRWHASNRRYRAI